MHLRGGDGFGFSPNCLADILVVDWPVQSTVQSCVGSASRAELRLSSGSDGFRANVAYIFQARLLTTPNTVFADRYDSWSLQFDNEASSEAAEFISFAAFSQTQIQYSIGSFGINLHPNTVSLQFRPATALAAGALQVDLPVGFSVGPNACESLILRESASALIPTTDFTCMQVGFTSVTLALTGLKLITPAQTYRIEMSVLNPIFITSSVDSWNLTSFDSAHLPLDKARVAGPVLVRAMRVEQVGKNSVRLRLGVRMDKGHGISWEIFQSRSGELLSVFPPSLVPESATSWKASTALHAGSEVILTGALPTNATLILTHLNAAGTPLESGTCVVFF